MKSSNLAWYHTGLDSFENPEIALFPKHQEASKFSWGPFPTFIAAKSDMIEMIMTDIHNRRTALKNVRALNLRKGEKLAAEIARDA